MLHMPRTVIEKKENCFTVAISQLNFSQINGSLNHSKLHQEAQNCCRRFIETTAIVIQLAFFPLLTARSFMLTTVARDQKWPDVVAVISAHFSKFAFVLFCFVLLCNKSLNDWSLREQSLSVQYFSMQCYTVPQNFKPRQ